MRRKRRGYRGRRSGGALIPTLCVLCLCAGLVSLYLHRNLVYTPDGMELKMPFGRTITLGGEAPIEDEEVNLIIEDAEDTPPAPEEETEILQNEEGVQVRAVFVSLDTLLGGGADALIERAKGSRINTVVLEVKAEDGRLAFVSKSELAKNANAASDAAVKAAIEKLKACGMRAVAQLACLRDNIAPRARWDLAVRTADQPFWLDPGENRWLNAYQPGTAEYLKTLLGEVYDLGFEEVLLTKLHFPVNGRQSLISYSGTDKTGAMNSLVAALKETADEHGGVLCAMYENHSPSQTEERPGGQDIETFKASFARIYSAASVEVMNALLGGGDKLVPVISEGTPSGDVYLYIAQEYPDAFFSAE